VYSPLSFLLIVQFGSRRKPLQESQLFAFEGGKGVCKYPANKKMIPYLSRSYNKIGEDHFQAPY
jgi:hypothetical protein